MDLIVFATCVFSPQAGGHFCAQAFASMAGELTSSVAGTSGGSSDDDGEVEIEIMRLSGDVIYSIEGVSADATIGNFKARLKQAGIDFAPWHCIVVGPASFEMADDYCRFMLTKAVKQAMVHREDGRERKKLSVMVVYADL